MPGLNRSQCITNNGCCLSCKRQKDEAFQANVPLVAKSLARPCEKSTALAKGLLTTKVTKSTKISCRRERAGWEDDAVTR